MGKYVIGMDYGTLSLRGVVADPFTGKMLCEAVEEYPHSILTEVDGKPLPGDYALEHPEDYRVCMKKVISRLLKTVKPEDICGIGIDFTSATVVALDEKLEPLCNRPEFADHPLAYAKLWKHHGATEQAKRIVATAAKRGETFLSYYGGSVNAEGGLPKHIELAEKDPQVYAAAAHLMESGDWLVSLLTGHIVRSYSMASCNSSYVPGQGYPSREFMQELSPAAANVADKLTGPTANIGEKAGELTQDAAAWLGLQPGIAVAGCNIDSHAPFPACGASEVGDVNLVLGTSGIVMLLGTESEGIPCCYSTAPDALLPGLWGYESGQSSVGDSFAWFAQHACGQEDVAQAREKGIPLQVHLTEKAAQIAPGKNGILVLNYLNGQRAPVMEPGLSGAIFGLRLSTRPHHIYRGFLESVAMETRLIMETMEQQGQSCKRIFAAGGIPAKNPLLMQIMADMLGREIVVCGQKEASAWGSAMTAASAAGLMTLREAMANMTPPPRCVYAPQNPGAYETTYARYKALAKEFSQPDSVLKEL